MSPLQFARATALEPAKAFGLYPRKGALQIGSDADVVVIDPNVEWTWPAFATGWGSDWEPFGGIRGRGLPTLTVRRGEIVARDGRFIGRNGGEYVRRPVDATWEQR
jgi:allantoinase